MDEDFTILSTDTVTDELGYTMYTDSMYTVTNGSEESASTGIVIAYWERVIVGIIYLVIFLLGIIGNSMVIIAVILSRKLREPTNCMITNLAVSDLLTCLMLIWNVVALLSKSGWPIAGWICSLAGTVIYTSSGTSLYSLAIIGVNRLIKITKPKYFPKIYTYRNVGIMIFLTWITPLPLILIPPLLGVGQIGYDESDYTCSDVELHPKSDTYNYFQLAVIPIPLFTIIICYSWILTHIRRHFKLQRIRRSFSSSLNRKPSSFAISESEFTSSPGPGSSKKSFFSSSISNMKINGVTSSPQRTHEDRIDSQQLAVTMNLFYVVLAFLICSLPYLLALLLAGLVNTDHFMIYAGAILLASSAINPVIYAWKHPHFKIVLKAMVLCRFQDIPQPSWATKRVVKRIAIELPSSSLPSRSNSKTFPSRSRSNSKSLPSRPSFKTFNPNTSKASKSEGEAKETPTV
ncbi:protein trapped in endoderm-1-like [Amphiura filiformis]|uniref:protein trapped in endoderm-1-like n=1 Tax=Amphiura filiformis TaxID=82378 RepID=UPI003B227AC0